MLKSPKLVLPTKLLWVDLEMTGLDPSKDVIQEVSVVVTDFSFRELARYETIVNHPRELLEDLMAQNEWFLEHEGNRQAFLDAAGTGKTDDQVSAELKSFAKEHFGDEPAILAGNSIYNDRGFIKRWWPEFDSALRYRMLDVSSWKVLMQGTYGVEYTKSETHRAHDDILESIAELQYYLRWFEDRRAEG